MTPVNSNITCLMLILLISMAAAQESTPARQPPGSESAYYQIGYNEMPMGRPMISRQDHDSSEVGLGPQPGDEPEGVRLFRRQVSYPQLDQIGGGQQQQQQAPQAEQGGAGSVFKFFSDLGPQMERAKAISTLFSSSPSSSSSPNQAQQQQTTGFNPMQMMAQLTELIRSTQDRNAKALETTQRSANQAVSESVDAAKQAQGGIQAALTEIGSALQRMAMNNPNLLPDIKNLYQSVSSKLSSASNSVAQVAVPQAQKSGPEQFAEQLAKAGQA